MDKISGFLNSPKLHRAIALLLTIGGMFAPAEYQKYIFGVAMVLAALGYALPDNLAKKVDALVESHGALIDATAAAGVDTAKADALAPETKAEKMAEPGLP